MRNFQDTFKTRKETFISAFLICMTVPLRVSQATVQTKMLFFGLKIHKNQEKSVPFCLKCTILCFLWKLFLFYKLANVSHIKWRHTALN